MCPGCRTGHHRLVNGSRICGIYALSGIAVAALLTLIGHLGPNNDLDPWTLTVSDFAVSNHGGVIEIAMWVTAGATVAAFVGLGQARVRIGTGASTLLAIWTGGLLVAAVVPTDEPGLPISTAGYVHRYASIAAFLALPVGGWSLAANLPDGAARWVRRLAAASLACALVLWWSAYPGERVLYGLIERLLLLAEIGLLATVAAALVSRRITPGRAASAAGRPRSPSRTAMGRS